MMAYISWKDLCSQSYLSIFVFIGETCSKKRLMSSTNVMSWLIHDVMNRRAIGFPSAGKSIRINLFLPKLAIHLREKLAIWLCFELKLLIRSVEATSFHLLKILIPWLKKSCFFCRWVWMVDRERPRRSRRFFSRIICQKIVEKSG